MLRTKSISECRLHHTIFVMNPAYSVYFGRYPVVHRFCGSWDTSQSFQPRRKPRPMRRAPTSRLSPSPNRAVYRSTPHFTSLVPLTARRYLATSVQNLDRIDRASDGRARR